MPESLPYLELREFFANDDSDFCDIAVPDARRGAWARFLKEVVPKWPHRFTLSRPNEEEMPQAIPDEPMEVLLLAKPEEGPWPSLCMDLAGLEVRVHFFGPDWLEPDFWRGEVTEESYAAIVQLMRQMGDAMEHDIFLTPEKQEIEGELVYEAAARRFRRPRRGEGADAQVRAKLLADLDDALWPMRAFIQDLEKQGGRHDASLPDDMVPPVLQRVEEIQSGFTELTLQDALTVEERRWLRNVWESLTMITQRHDSPIDWQRLLSVVRARG